MKAALCEAYGPPENVKVVEVAKPEPAQDEVLIKVMATTVNSGDARVRALRVPGGLKLPMRLKFGWKGPKQPILGLDAAGQVEAVGTAVTRFKPGDRVIASREFKFGCHAEYTTIAENGAVAVLPAEVSYEDAVALCFGGPTALIFFDLGKLKSGESILINGASGAVGTMAVQIAKHRGATVTAVCSGRNRDLVEALGADHVSDYTEEDFTQNGEQYDLIMDNHGNAPYKRIKQSLKPGGRFLMVVPDSPQMVAGVLNKAIVTPSPTSGTTAAILTELMNLKRAGALKPVVDSVWPLEQIAEAHSRVDSGHKVGSVVIRVGSAGSSD